MSVRDRSCQLVWRLRHPRTTVRGRLTLLYGSLFLASGGALLAVTYVLVERNFPIVNQKFTPFGVGSISGGLTSPGGRGSSPNSPSALAALVSAQRNTDLHHLLVDCLIVLGIMAVVSVALGWLVAGRVLRPLRTIAATTRQISEDNLHQRLASEGPQDELKDLSDTIDGLLARLEGAFEAQRRFVANASHELRTPVTVARALLEMILSDPAPTLDSFRSTCEEVLAAGEHQEGLIEALLTLARSQRGLDHEERFDLAHVVGDVVEPFEEIAIAKGLNIQIAIEPTQVVGDLRLVERLVSNLVENALNHNVPNGRIDVAVRTRAGNPSLRVANTGPRVPPLQIDRLLQPFQRLANDRAGDHDGLGLGLSIVAAIANAHGAVLSVEPGDTGLDIEVTFPRVAVDNGGSDASSERAMPARTES
jgi:signal transduction histidine kinase